MDNIFSERLSHSLKYKEVYAFSYRDGQKAYRRVANWI